MDQPLAPTVRVPCVQTLHHPDRYTADQINGALAIARQATDTLGQHDGYVRGDIGHVIGVYGDRGVLVLTEPPAR